MPLQRDIVAHALLNSGHSYLISKMPSAYNARPATVESPKTGVLSPKHSPIRRPSRSSLELIPSQVHAPNVVDLDTLIAPPRFQPLSNRPHLGSSNSTSTCSIKLKSPSIPQPLYSSIAKVSSSRSLLNSA